MVLPVPSLDTRRQPSHATATLFSYTVWAVNNAKAILSPMVKSSSIGHQMGCSHANSSQPMKVAHVSLYVSGSISFASCESCVEGAAVLLVGLCQSFGVILGVDILLATSPLEHSVTYSVPLTQSPVFFSCSGVYYIQICTLAIILSFNCTEV